MDDANELNRILRGLLISNPRKTSASYLKKDFYENYGKEFPFVKFGFRSFCDYLRSIPDVVQVIETGHPDPTVMPVTSEKSAHIESLIMRQRTNTKSKEGRKRLPPRRPTASLNRYFQPKNEVPSLLSMPPIPKPTYDKQFSPGRTIYTHSNDYKMNNNYSNCASNLQCVPLPQFISQHVRRLVNNNPSGISLCELSKTIFWNDIHGLRSSLTTLGITNVTDLLNKCSSFVSIKGNLVFPRYFQRPEAFTPIRPAGEEDYFNSDDDLDMEFSDDFDNNVGPKDVADNKKENLRLSPKDKACAEVEVADDQDELSTKVIENFRRLLKIYPEGISCSQLPEFYHKEFGVSLDFQDWGYSSIIQMASRLPKVFHYVREGSCSDWKLYDARLKSVYSSNGCTKEKTNLLEQKWIPQSVLENVRKLLAEHPTGVLSSVFLEKYAEKYNNRLNLHDLGFDSLEAFLNAIEDIVHFREGYNKLFLLPKKLRRLEDLPKPSVPALPEFQKLIPQLYPKEVCGQNFALSPYTIDEERPLLMQVRVTEVATPSCFWMVPESYWDELEEMMTDLNDFYDKTNEDNERYLMPESTILKDQLCVARYGIETRWHRAKILHYFSIDDEVKVEYVDYGTIGKVARSVIRFLHKDFAVLPKLSVKAKLFGIQCLTPRWPKECNVQMLDLVNERSLIAEIINCINEEPFVDVVLYEAGPDGVKEYVINSFFVDTGAAEYAKLDDIVSNSSISSSIPNSPQSYDLESVQHTSTLTNDEVNFTSPSEGMSNVHQRTHSPPEDILCMSTSVRPPPGFTEKDKALCNVYPEIVFTPPVISANVAGMFIPRDTNNAVLESFRSGLQIGQQMQTSPLNYGNSIYNQLNPSQLNMNQSFQPVNPSELLLQLLSLRNSSLYNATQSIPGTVQSIPIVELPQTPTNLTPDNFQTISTSTNNSETPNSPAPFSEKFSTNSSDELKKDKYEDSTIQDHSQDNSNRKKAIWSPIEIDKKFIKKNISMFECKILESKTPMSSTSFKSKVLSDSSKQEIGYKQSSNTPNTPLLSNIERKTPDCWEDILSDDGDTRIKLFGGCASEQLLPKEKVLSSNSVDETRPINGIKKKYVKKNIKMNNGFVIPKLGHKELLQMNKVSTCLRDIKIVDEPEEDIRIVDEPKRNIKTVSENETKKCLLKEIKIGTKTLHVMKMKDTVMASSEEVIRTFTSFSVRNSVIKILDSKMISFPFLDIYRNENEELFKEVDKTELLAFHNKGANSLIKMNVLPLEVVPQLLSVLKVKNSYISDFNKALSDCKDDKEW